MEFILSNIPEFQQAQHELDLISEQWQSEIQSRSSVVKEMQRKFEVEEVLYTDEVRKTKIREIGLKEKALSDFTQSKYGSNGELFKKRQELIKPIQDAIYEAVEKLAKDKKYDFVLDKSAGITILYAKTSYDKSDLVLKYLGY